MKTIDELINSRHDTWLEWVEPWPNREGNPNVVVKSKATVHDCIEIQAWARRNNYLLVSDDAALLQDFIAVHWATEVE